MMTLRMVLTAGVMLAAVLARGDEDLKSGPPVGAEVPGPFKPYNVNGPQAGERSCLYCRYGTNPVVMVFAREVTPPLTKLIEKLDAAAARHADAKLGACVVFLGSRDRLEGKLKELDEKLVLKHLVLAIDTPPGPEPYAIAKQADVTVLLYTDTKVKGTHAFRKGELNDKAVETILDGLPKIHHLLCGACPESCVRSVN
jgi:hypothetical protein